MSDEGRGVLTRLLSRMEEGGASDLFICEGKPPAIRKHGRVVSLNLSPTTHAMIDELLEELLTPLSRKRFEETGDLDVGYSLRGSDEDGPGRRFRFNLARQRGVVSLVARALPSGELDFGELGLPKEVARFADLPRGLVLVSGATGSGKSTTLAAMIHRINSLREVHIVSIEDPIEFVHVDQRARITQREVGSDTVSFHAALRHVLRESPDVIVIGEMRDRETTEVALAAALTGHLVLATVHTIDATQTVQRILSTFPEHLRGQAAMDLSLSLEGVVSQRLIPRRDGQGRVVATEVLTCTPPVRLLLREQRVDELYDLMRASNDPRIVPFNQALLELLKAERISYELGVAYATNPDEFTLGARGMEIGVRAFRGAADAETVGLDLKGLLEHAIDIGASDLHITVGRPPIFRLHGKLVPMDTAPLSAEDLRTLLYSILTVRQRTRYELDRELDFALQLPDGRRFRVNAYWQKGLMSASLRAIPIEIPSAGELGLPEQLVQLGKRSHGLLLVVGPTGSGKSTTLACLIDQINKSRACRIITIEDPIEYVHEPIRATVDQREVSADTPSFASALKYILRQDPDVILVGEMRDLETISAALTAAETGHLVLATLHANDATQTIDRIIDVFPPHQQAQARSQLAASLVGIVSQRLLPRKDGAGRFAAFEVLVATTAIRNIVREGKMHQARSLMEGSRGQGMVTMDRALGDLVRQDMIHYHDALPYVANPKNLGPAPVVDPQTGETI